MEWEKKFGHEVVNKWRRLTKQQELGSVADFLTGAQEFISQLSGTKVIGIDNGEACWISMFHVAFVSLSCIMYLCSSSCHMISHASDIYSPSSFHFIRLELGQL